MTPDVNSWPLPKYPPAHRPHMYMHTQTCNTHIHLVPPKYF